MDIMQPMLLQGDLEMAAFWRIFLAFSVDLMVKRANVVLAHRAKVEIAMAFLPPVCAQALVPKIAHRRRAG